MPSGSISKRSKNTDIVKTKRNACNLKRIVVCCYFCAGHKFVRACVRACVYVFCF